MSTISNQLSGSHSLPVTRSESSRSGKGPIPAVAEKALSEQDFPTIRGPRRKQKASASPVEMMPISSSSSDQAVSSPSSKSRRAAFRALKTECSSSPRSSPKGRSSSTSSSSSSDRSESLSPKPLTAKQVKSLTNYFIKSIELRKDYDTVKKAFDAIPKERISELSYARLIDLAIREQRYDDAKAAFHDALLENKTGKVDYGRYSKFALANDDLDEVFRVYQLSNTEGKISWRTKMDYTHLLMGKGKIEEAKSIYQELQAEIPSIDELNMPKITKYRAFLDLHGYSHGAGFLAWEEFMKTPMLPGKITVITGKGKREDNHLIFRNYMLEKIQEELRSQKLTGWTCEADPVNEGTLNMVSAKLSSPKSAWRARISRDDAPRRSPSPMSRNSSGSSSPASSSSSSSDEGTPPTPRRSRQRTMGTDGFSSALRKGRPHKI